MQTLTFHVTRKVPNFLQVYYQGKTGGLATLILVSNPLMFLENS